MGLGASLDSFANRQSLSMFHLHLVQLTIPTYPRMYTVSRNSSRTLGGLGLTAGVRYAKLWFYYCWRPS